MADQLPFGSASRIGNLIVNPSGGTPGQLETYLRGPAWWLLDMTPFWDMPDQRGQDVIIPGADGERAFRRRITGTTYVAPFHIVGGVTVSGAVSASAADPLVGLRANRDYLRANVHAPLTSGPWTDGLVLPGSSGSITTTGHCALKIGHMRGGAGFDALFSVKVPRGGFDL